MFDSCFGFWLSYSYLTNTNKIIIYHFHSIHTLHTVRNNLVNLRLHIAPVGFEIDRIVIPAKDMKADKVWLLVHENPSDDKALPFVEKIQKQLKKANIKVGIEYHNRLDLFQIIKTTKELIEKESPNDIFVNMASGSKIQAIALMMTCMMFGKEKRVTPFYAEAEDYPGFAGKQMSYGVKNIMQLPIYKMQVPKFELIQALKIVKENKGRITKKQMAKLAVDEKLIVVNAKDENVSQATFASLDKNIIQPLQDQWKFIETEKIGRNRWIKITQEGINAAEFLT